MPEFAPVINVSTLNGTTGFRLDGRVGGRLFRLAPSGGGGDVNGDGFADLLVRALLLENRRSAHRGLAWVVFGAASNPGAQGSRRPGPPPVPPYRFQGEVPG